MSAQFALSARPASAAIAWATRDGLFVEIPCASGPPLICRYRATEEGLRLALNVLLETPERAPRKPTAEHPMVRRPKPEFDDAERGKVRDILKNLKVI